MIDRGVIRVVVRLFCFIVLAGTAPVHADWVKGTGHVLYHKKGSGKGDTAPLKGVRVNLMDSDPFWDETLGSGYANSKGYYSVSGTGSDFIGGYVDPYVEFELQSKDERRVVESEFWKINLSCESPAKNSTKGAIDFKSRACSGDSANGSVLFANLGEAYSTFTELTGDKVPSHAGKAAVLYPSTFTAGVPFTTEESVHWPGGYTSYSSLYHEFGHRIRHGQDGSFAHFLSDAAKYTYAQSHWPEKKTNSGFAFNEGWAEYFASIFSSKKQKTLSSWKPLVYDNGSNNVEGNVSARLYKLALKCGGFGQMWKTLKLNGIHTYGTFRTKLKTRFDSSSTLRKAYPNCLSTIQSAENQAADLPDATVTLVSSRRGNIGAFSPLGKENAVVGASAALQRDAINGAAQNIEQRASAVAKTLNNSRWAKLPNVGPKVIAQRIEFEQSSARKAANYLRGRTPIEATEEAIRRRDAQDAEFVKGILRDRIATLKAQRAVVQAARAKQPTADDARLLAAMSSKIDRGIPELEKAIETGQVRPHHLPRSFRGSAVAVEPVAGNR